MYSRLNEIKYGRLDSCLLCLTGWRCAEDLSSELECMDHFSQ